MDSENARKAAQSEKDKLEFFKTLSNPNIAEVLFAFQEEDPPSLSLVFDYHPIDLSQILYSHKESEILFPGDSPEMFPGSRLNSYLWFGMLGVFDAVAAVHEPQNHTQSIPKKQNTTVLGGHFDIKPENILVGKHCRFLLTDFELSYVKEVVKGQEANFTIGAHTYPYRPPPSYSKHKPPSPKDPHGAKWWSQDYDIWSLGCVCIELLAYIIDGEKAPAEFRAERVKEGSERDGNFWTRERGTEVVQKCVLRRLSKYKQLGDDYLTRVASQIEKMLQIPRAKTLTVKACHRELSVSVQVNRSMFQGKNDREIAGEGTQRCLQKMRTSFSTGRVSLMPCSLYLWANMGCDKTTLTIEFGTSEEQTMVVTGTSRTSREEIIPISLFDTESVFDQNRLRNNAPFLQCAFRIMHDGTIFHFAKWVDFNHFFGAVTHQRVCSNSIFRLKSCQLETGSTLNTKKWTAADGHIQIWQYLEEKDYLKYYTPQNPTISVQQYPETETSRYGHSSSPVSEGEPASGAAHTPPGIFRLVLFLRTKESAMIVVLSLNHASFYASFKRNDGKYRMKLERRFGEDKIFGVMYEGKASADHSSDPQGLSGIPLSNAVLSENIEKGKGIKRVKMDFWSLSDLNDFQSYYKSVMK